MTDATKICIAEFDGWTDIHLCRIDCELDEEPIGIQPNWRDATTYAVFRERPGIDGTKYLPLPDLTLDYLRDVRVRRFTAEQMIKFNLYLFKATVGYWKPEDMMEYQSNAMLHFANATTDQVASAMEKVIKESGK